MLLAFSRCSALLKTEKKNYVFLYCIVQFVEEISERAVNYLAVSIISNVAALAHSSAG